MKSSRLKITAGAGGLALIGVSVAVALPASGGTAGSSDIGNPSQISVGPNAPAAKRSVVEKMDQRILDARNAPTASKADTPPTIPIPSSEPLTAGIDDDMHQGPFPSSVFTVNNFWQGPVNGQWLDVYVGTAADRSALRVYSRNPDPDMPADTKDLGSFPTPSSAQDLRAVGESGNNLTLSNGDVFDLSALSFDSK